MTSPVPLPPTDSTATRSDQPFVSVMKGLDRRTKVGAAILLVLFLVALAAPLIAPDDPEEGAPAEAPVPAPLTAASAPPARSLALP